MELVTDSVVPNKHTIPCGETGVVRVLAMRTNERGTSTRLHAATPSARRITLARLIEEGSRIHRFCFVPRCVPKKGHRLFFQELPRRETAPRPSSYKNGTVHEPAVTTLQDEVPARGCGVTPRPHDVGALPRLNSDHNLDGRLEDNGSGLLDLTS